MNITDRFRPRWKNSDPDIRIMAIGQIRDPGILADIAAKDGNFRVRLKALEHIQDSGVLQKIAMADDNPQVRIAAVCKLEDPLVLRAVAAHDLEAKVRLAAVDKIFKTDVLQEIAGRNPNPHVRLAAVRKIDDQDILADIAQHGQCKATRMEAMKRIRSWEILAHIVTGGQDMESRFAAAEKLLTLPGHVDRGNAVMLSKLFTSIKSIDDMAFLGKCFSLMQRIKDPGVFVTIAASRAHYLLRWEALSNISDPAFLQRLATQDEHPRIRMAATARLTDSSVLFGIATSDEDPCVRMAAVSRLSDFPSLVAICESDTDIRCRMAALTRISDPALLEHAAASNTMRMVRMAAAGKLAGTAFVADLFRVHITAFLGKRRNPARSMPETNMVLAQLQPLLVPETLAVLASLDLPQAVSCPDREQNTQTLAVTATTAPEYLARLSAAGKIHRPSVLVDVISACSEHAKDGLGVHFPQDDFARWAALAKLESPFIFLWAGFDADYTQKLLNESLLACIMAGESFAGLKVIAEERYNALVTVGSKYHTPFGDSNMYVKH